MPLNNWREVQPPHKCLTLRWKATFSLELQRYSPAKSREAPAPTRSTCMVTSALTPSSTTKVAKKLSPAPKVTCSGTVSFPIIYTSLSIDILKAFGFNQIHEFTACRAHNLSVFEHMHHIGHDVLQKLVVMGDDDG